MQREASAEPDFVPGSNFVGVLLGCSEDVTERFGIRAGSRVASLIRWGANTRYVKVPPQHLFAVPKNLDAADIASLISFYLPAFLVLHHGRPRPARSSNSCLRGKRLLVVADGATLEVQALLRLAQLAGASEIFVAVPWEHHAVLKKSRVTVLKDDPSEWLPEVERSMAVVVDYSFPKNFSSVRSALEPKGQLICCPQSRHVEDRNLVKSDCTPTMKLTNMLERYQLAMMDHATIFDFKEYVEQFHDDVFEDLTFLLTLLSTRTIRPHVDRFITLEEIPRAHRKIRSNAPLSGAIICEPWKEYS